MIKILKKKLPRISKLENIDWKKIDIIFTALPNGEAQKIAKRIPKGIKLIDLSGDFRLNNYDKAKILYNDILKIDPDNLFVNHNLGLINSNNKEYDIAKKYFLKAININDKSYKSFIQLALSLN